MATSPRADARRNRAPILRAAEETFSAGGGSVSLDEIALRRRGPGTRPTARSDEGGACSRRSCRTGWPGSSPRRARPRRRRAPTTGSSRSAFGRWSGPRCTGRCATRWRRGRGSGGLGLLGVSGLVLAAPSGWPVLAAVKAALDGGLLTAAALHVVTGRSAMRPLVLVSRVLAVLLLTGSLMAFWLGVQLAG